MKILLLAGEESGELYAAQLRERLAGHEIRGYGDSGFAIADLAVMGFFAVLRRLRFFLRVKRTMEGIIDCWRPDLVLTIDYPGMNLKLAAYARRRGIRAVHVVCPQVWAWKQGRIPKIEAALDRLCCFFPFEPKLFRGGFAAFVGHPLAKDFPAFHPAASALAERATIALLPGSRQGEIRKILPPLLKTAELLAHRFPEISFTLPAANERARSVIAEILASSAIGGRITVTSGGARAALLNARAAIVASGTATLEAALARCPTVLVYRVGPLLAFLARRLIKGVKHLGLANILWERGGGEGVPPMPELLQEDFTPAATAAVLTRWLEDPAERAAVIARLDAVVSTLETDGDPIGNIVEIALGNSAPEKFEKSLSESAVKAS